MICRLQALLTMIEQQRALCATYARVMNAYADVAIAEAQENADPDVSRQLTEIGRKLRLDAALTETQSLVSAIADLHLLIERRGEGRGCTRSGPAAAAPPGGG